MERRVPWMKWSRYWWSLEVLCVVLIVIGFIPTTLCIDSVDRATNLEWTRSSLRPTRNRTMTRKITTNWYRHRVTSFVVPVIECLNNWLLWFCLWPQCSLNTIRKRSSHYLMVIGYWCLRAFSWCCGCRSCCFILCVRLILQWRKAIWNVTCLKWLSHKSFKDVEQNSTQTQSCTILGKMRKSQLWVRDTFCK